MVDHVLGPSQRHHRLEANEMASIDVRHIELFADEQDVGVPVGALILRCPEVLVVFHALLREGEGRDEMERGEGEERCGYCAQLTFQI